MIFQKSVDTYWDNQIIPHYLIESFCMLEITAKKIDVDQQTLPSYPCIFDSGLCYLSCSNLL